MTSSNFENISTSVIVPTYNGARKIVNLLHCLTVQSVADFEVIVVVDGSTDNTLDVLRQFEGTFKKFSVIAQQNYGRSIVRNNGAQAAIGALLIFYDDDMSPYPDSVSRHQEFHKKISSAVLAGHQAEFHSADKTDFRNYKAHMAKKWLAPYNRGLSRLTADNFFLSAANFSIERGIFFKLSGFNSSLKDHEDYEFAHRVLNANFELWFDSDNIAIHNDLVTCRSYIARLRQYEKEERKLAELNPDIARTRLMKQTIPMFKKSIYWLFSFGFWPDLIDNFNLLLLLPKIIRFKIYDIIVFSSSKVYPDS
jgi:glycosyltransferase involved in cell wall biosynthesis